MEETGNIADETKVRQGSLESQFQSVLDETTGKDVISAPEILAAKVGADGKNHSNLKQRLDSEYNEVSQNLAQKAQQTELNIERARIDNLTALPEGSTIGDAELMDIRVGADGNTYNNAGDAIRGQVSKLNETLKKTKDDVFHEVYNYGEPTLKHIQTNGNITANSNKNVCFATPILALKGSKITVDSPDYKFQLALYDKDTDLFVERITWMNYGTIYTLRDDYKVRLEISFTDERVLSDTSIFSHLDYQLIGNTYSRVIGKEHIVFTRGFTINTGGVIGSIVNIIPTVVNPFSYAIINVSEGEGLNLNIFGGANARAYCFIDKDNKILSVSDVDIKLENYVVIAPKGSARCIINSMNDHIGECYKYSNDIVKENIDIMKRGIKDEVIINTQEAIEQTSSIVDLLGLDFFKEKTITVTTPNKYNAWPFVGKVNQKIVCVYSKGGKHEGDPSYGVYAKTSKNGVVWGIEKIVVDTLNVRDSVTGKGHDTNGNMLIWVRKGEPWEQTTVHELYKTSDGDIFTKISSPTFPTVAGHIGDIFNVPTVGLIAFYNTYGTNRAWGVVISSDNGISWTQKEIESGLTTSECPMEISGVYIADGKILAIGRKENSEGTVAQFQIQSSDYGSTWTKVYTNITDIRLSTPSLIYDSTSDTVSLYYFQRGIGVLRLRKNILNDIWDKALNWSVSKIIANGTNNISDTGNVNAVPYGENHIATYYSGDSINTGIYAVIV